MIDVGSTTEKKIDYFDCAQTACKMLQKGEADRAILFCGTGMGMSIIANKFAGITAAGRRNDPCGPRCVARSTMRTFSRWARCAGVPGTPIWRSTLSLKPKWPTRIPAFADYLAMAKKKVEAIDEANRK